MSNDNKQDSAPEGADNKKKKKRSALPFILIIIGCAAVLTFALIQIIRTQLEYKHARDVTDTAVSSIIKTEPKPSESGESEEPEEEEFSYDHEAALALNPDAKGLIYIPAIDQKLPIVQKLHDETNEYYLHRGFDGAYSRAGTVYIDTHIEEGLAAKHIILYGHHMGDGTMFSDNDKYRDSAFYKEPGNDTFYIYTPDSVQEYKIFSVYTPSPTGDTYTINFGTDEELREYAGKWKSYSFYDTGVDISNASKIVTLSSCDIKTGYKLRLAVQGVMVNETKNQ